MILVDTSVWIDHLRSGEPRLVELLEVGEVRMHPFVLGELACGSLGNRREVLRYLGNLPPASVATDAEALDFIEHRALMGRGIDYVDVHLLASAALDGDGTQLWTRDKDLDLAGRELDLSFSEGA